MDHLPNQRKKPSLSQIIDALNLHLDENINVTHNYSIQKSPMDFNPALLSLKNGFGHIWVASSVEDAELGFYNHKESNFYVLCVKAPKCQLCTNMSQVTSFFN